MTAFFDRASQIEGMRSSARTPEARRSHHGPEAGLIAYAQTWPPRDITLEEATEIGAELRELMPEIEGVQDRDRGAILAEFEARAGVAGAWPSP